MKNFLRKIHTHRHNITAVTVGQAVAALGTLCGVRLLTEFISPGVFGSYKLLLAAISLVTGIFFRPFIQFAMREYHDAERSGILPQFNAFIRNLSTKYFSVVAIGITLILFFIFPDSKPYSPFLLLLIPALIIFQASVELERALMITKNQQIHASAVSVSRNWLIPMTIVTLSLCTSKSLTTMFVATLVVLVSIYAVQRFLLSSKENSVSDDKNHIPRSQIIKDAVAYGLPLAAVGFLGWLVHESDRFFLSYYHSEEVVGIYSAAYGLVSAPFTLVVGSMAQFLYPVMFKVSAANDRARKLKVLKAMLTASTIICLCGIIFIGIFSEQIAWIALGESYRQEAAGLFIWIATGYGCLAISMCFDLAAYGEKKTSDLLIAYGVAAIVNVSFNFLLIPVHGAYGAVIATLLSLISYLVLMSLLFYRRHRASSLLIHTS